MSLIQTLQVQYNELKKKRRDLGLFDRKGRQELDEMIREVATQLLSIKNGSEYHVAQAQLRQVEEKLMNSWK